MRLSIAQMTMKNDLDANYNKIMQFSDLADTHKADLVFYPKLCTTPYFPQFHKRDIGGVLEKVPSELAAAVDDERVKALCGQAKKYGIYLCPNLYISRRGFMYDLNLWIDANGVLSDDSGQLFVEDRPDFYEKEYFHPFEGGVCLHETSFGMVGIVTGYDRHIAESITGLADAGADLVIIPAANVMTEPGEMYEWELRVAAYQNSVFIAMANRVGTEGALVFNGGSIVIDPNGDIVVKADDTQQFIICNIELSDSRQVKSKRFFRREMNIYR